LIESWRVIVNGFALCPYSHEERILTMAEKNDLDANMITLSVSGLVRLTILSSVPNTIMPQNGQMTKTT